MPMARDFVVFGKLNNDLCLMNPITFFYFRNHTKAAPNSVELFGLGETSNHSLHYEIKEGDSFDLADLKEADHLTLHRFTKNIPIRMVVREITLENNEEIKNGIRKVYLEADE